MLVCSSDHIEVGVGLDSLLSIGLSICSGHLAAAYCSRYRMHDNVLWYQVPRQADMCGTKMTVRLPTFCFITTCLINVNCELI